MRLLKELAGLGGGKMPDSEEKIIEFIRLAYLAGISDTEDGSPRWCPQGSKQKAEELLEEFKKEIAATTEER